MYLLSLIECSQCGIVGVLERSFKQPGPFVFLFLGPLNRQVMMPEYLLKKPREGVRENSQTQ